MNRRLAVGLLLVGALAGPTLAGADVSVNVNIGPPPPIVVAAPPPLVVIPAVPVVQYAPSLHVDLFVVGGHWYYWHGEHWFVGSSYQGPWAFVPAPRVPRPLLAVPATFYKVPPGHLKRGGGGGPPGHAKGKGKGHD